MNNTELVENIARKLEKFNLTEIVSVAEIDENEVNNILEQLIASEKIIKRNNLYFYQRTLLKPKVTRKERYTNVPLFEPEKADGYDEYLKLTGRAKNLTDRRIMILKMTNGLYGSELKKMLKLYNQQHPKEKFAPSTLAALKLQFKNYGFRGIIAKSIHSSKEEFPSIIYETFKKYYLNKNKFSSEEALRLAQLELQNLHKIEFPQVYSAKAFINRLLKELGKETITYLRDTVEFCDEKKNENKFTEATDMIFADAANIYLKKLKNSHNLQKLMNEKTSYDNHISDYFDNYKIKDITAETIRNYKQSKFNSGYSISSVNFYIGIVKAIIFNICPETSNFKKKVKMMTALEMNILTENQIKNLLGIAKEKYVWGYPIIRLALTTGATVPEILALTWEDINFTHGKIYIKQFLYLDKIVKHRVNSSFRHLTVDRDIVESLLKQYQDSDIPDKKDFVFKKKNISNMQKYFTENVLEPVCKELKIEKFMPSDLIHNFVNLLLKQNAPISYIKTVCGYSSISGFLEVYNSQFEKTEKEYYNPLKNIL